MRVFKTKRVCGYHSANVSSEVETSDRESVLQSRAQCDTGLLALSDDLVTRILAHLNLNEVARLHMVSRRFNRLLSRPDPSLRPYGACTFLVDLERRGELPSSSIDKYLLKRAAGFTRVCFQSWCEYKEGQGAWILMRDFFSISLPQLAAVLVKYHVQLEIVVSEGGGRMFFEESDSDLDSENGDELNQSHQFSAEWWEVLSPVLTKLDVTVGGIAVYVESQAWLGLMQKLQHLDFHGESLDGWRPTLFVPTQLSLPALRLLRVERFSSMSDCNLDCPSLEALHLREIQGLCVPTGLASSSRLTTLDIAAPLGPEHVGVDATLPPAIKSVQATLEILDVSGWAPGVLDLISTLPRLHTLVAQRMGLTAVPAIPATLKSLDLRANEFTEVPVQLELLTQLTSLALSSKALSANFQIRRPLDGIISLPQLQELTLVHEFSMDRPVSGRWGARSLYYLGLAQHELARSNSTLSLKF